MANMCRHIAKEDEEGAAGCKASESSQQTGAGRQEHFSCAEWPGETGDPSTDRNETCQVSHTCMLTVLYKQVYKILHCPLQDIFGNTWECHLQGHFFFFAIQICYHLHTLSTFILISI